MTRVETTLEAVKMMCKHMPHDSAISLVCYPHEEGVREVEELLSWSSKLPKDEWTVVNSIWTNRSGAPSHLLIVRNRLRKNIPSE